MKINSSYVGMESARSYKASSTTVRRFMIKDYQAGLMQNQNPGNTAPDDKSDTADNVKNDNKTGGARNESAAGGARNESAASSAKNESTVGGARNESAADSAKSEGMTGENAGTISPAYREWQEKYRISAEQKQYRASVGYNSVNHVSARSDSSNTYTYIRENSIRYIFELLFGSIRERFGWTDFTNDSTNITSTASSTSPDSVSSDDSVVTNFKMLVYSGEESYWESEETSFSTTGHVRTGDGREISFNINVGMSREFQSYYKEEMVLQSFQLCDPLVINLDTDVAELSDQKFYFDIDADGEKDEISMLGKGSGYLALDKNGDGKINDGNELFGTNSGDGFADLSRYDEDGNGWIDENDSIWSKLKIWCKDENGEDILYSLAEKGVGAICLQRASTGFALKDDTNQTQGVIRNTGVFLYENGTAGTIQHVDVAKYNKKA